MEILLGMGNQPRFGGSGKIGWARLTETNNTGRQVILAKTFKNDGSQNISCRGENCCYSCSDVAKIYSRDRANHGLKNLQDGFSSRLISVVNIIGDMAHEVENYCHKCLKNFTKESILIKHRIKCTGKQLFACNICSEGFQTHHAMVVHIKKWHRIDSSFKTTGIFVGKTKVKNTERGKKTPLGRVYEKSHVPITPGLNHVNQVLTPQLRKELLFFMKKEVMVNTILNFHFVLNCILAKPESDNYVKRIRYSARSQTEKISRASDIKS